MIDAEVGTEEWARQAQPPFVSRYTKVAHDPAFCCASVHEPGRSFGAHQCSRKPVTWYGALGYCKTHDPVARKQKREAQYQAWKDDANRIHAKHVLAARKEELGKEAVSALKAIANGHNDPMTLASEILAKYADIA